MTSGDDETILAVSSPAGASAISLLRLSGPAAVARVGELAEDRGAALAGLPAYRVALVALRGSWGRVQASVTVFRAPRSYTGEDVVEVALPGSPPLVERVVARLLEEPSGRRGPVRWARPGEFTLRAYRRGRIDFAQAESVALLIGATGEAEARASQRGLRGELGTRIEEVVHDVLECLALTEAGIDFPDEDLPQVSAAALARRVETALERLRQLQSVAALRISRDGALRVAITGFANAGKSSLLNALVGRRAALTSSIRGTTRDPVRAVTIHDGRSVEWIDLAGMSDPEALRFEGETTGEEPIWDIVRRLTRLELETSDKVLWVADPVDDLERSLAEFRRAQLPGKILVLQKGDLLAPSQVERFRALSERPVVVSAHQAWGLDELQSRVLGPAGGGPDSTTGSAAGGAEPLYLVSAHQEVQLGRAREALERARESAASGSGECAASDLRDALAPLEALRGPVGREALLDLVFSRFCIGK